MGEKDARFMKSLRRLGLVLCLMVGSVAVVDCGGGVSIGVSTQCDPGERRPATGTCKDPGREVMRVCGSNYRWGRPGCYPIEGAAEPIAEEPIVSDDAATDATPTDAALVAND